MRHRLDYIRPRLLYRSEVDTASPLLNGKHCRMWLRATNADGRGRMWDGKRLQYAPRLSYEAFVGPIPRGKDVLHECDRPGCIEPTHLKPGTQADNYRDWRLRGSKRP